MTFTVGDEHDPATLLGARKLIAELSGPRLADRISELVEQNDTWRRQRCVNLVAAESPTSPMVRAMLSAEVGARASGGHIGVEARCFPGMRYIDEFEAICVELLKSLFSAEFADQRLMGGMAGCSVAYASLASPGDIMMSLSLAAGGDSSGRDDGPAGVRGLRIYDIPFDPANFTVDMDAFAAMARRLRPSVVSVNQTTTLFALPIRAMKNVIAEWGGKLYFDGAHHAGLIAGGCFPNPLDQGADILTGSGGKTFSGPQSGIIVWNDERFSRGIVETIFPVLTGSHQLNRVAALAVACVEMREFGAEYMRQVIANAQALARALAERGLPVLAAHLGYTTTHQVLVDVRQWGGGFPVARRLELANIMVNKMLLPAQQDDPGGIRIGTVEVSRYGMTPADMPALADFIHRIVVRSEAPDTVASDVADFRSSFQRLRYCLPTATPAGLPGSSE